jgi:hypothetical protein
MAQLVLLMSMGYIFLQEDFGLGGLSMGLEVIGLKFLEKKQFQMVPIIFGHQ